MLFGETVSVYCENTQIQCVGKMQSFVTVLMLKKCIRSALITDKRVHRFSTLMRVVFWFGASEKRSFSIVRGIACKCIHDPSWARSDSRTVLITPLAGRPAGRLDRPSALSAGLCGVWFEELVAVCLLLNAFHDLNLRG
jgi:hypothetical protein